MARHYDATKELGTLGDQALIPSAISYEPKINSRTVQGERTKAGAQQDGGTAKSGAEIYGETQRGGGSGRTVNGAAVLARRP